MMLESKVAVIYGAGGPIGGAIARAFAREGAILFLAGRTERKVELTAERIRREGGRAEAIALDATDERSVDNYVDGVVARVGRIDISVNVIGYGDIQEPLLEISLQSFLQPISNAMRSQFLTTRAAARHMVRQHSGVILAFGGDGPQTMPGLGGFKIALDAIESLRRQWACELGEFGIRVVTLKSGGVPESISEAFVGRDALAEELRSATLLGQAATLADVGNVAAFVASDLARTITDTEVNISCGAIVD